MNTKTFYWDTHKNFVLDVLRYEFKGEFEITDNTWYNDECPSLLLQFETYTMQLFLPSNYKGEYSEYCLMVYNTYSEYSEYCLMVYNTYSDFENDNSETHFLLTNLNDVIEQLKTYL
jgi:hypothetical protein